MSYHGLLLIDKPSGLTSHDVVGRVRRVFGTKRVGHTGTLDPMATGLLLICIGNATRLAEYMRLDRKAYQAEITFGLETDTQDAWGATLCERDAAHITRSELLQAVESFRGTMHQVPPMYSAIKRDGKRLHELARAGLSIERDARPVEIFRLDLLDFVPGERAKARVDVVCSAGTYIRTLAHDMGQKLGVGAVMSMLVRTSIGDESRGFRLADAHSLDELSALAAGSSEQLISYLRPLTEALAGWPTVKVDDAQVDRIRNGQPLRLDQPIEAAGSDGMIAVLDCRSELIAVARLGPDGSALPVKVLAN